SSLYPKTAVVTVEVYFKTLPIFLDSVKFASNDSYILRTSNVTFETVNKTEYHKTYPFATNYTIRLKIGHQLTVGNYSDQNAVNLYYRKDNDTFSKYVEKIPFTWHIQTLDWSILSYFWIIFSGVLLSRMLTFRGQKTIKFTP